MRLNIVAIIPAKGGSKGIPRKNLVKLSGKPLISYSIKVAKKSKFINKVFVSTEDQEIANFAEKCGVWVINRPKNLAKDKTLTVPVIQHAVKYLERKEHNYIDIIVVLQPTSPLRNVEDIDNSIKKLVKTNADSVITFCEVEHSPYWMFKIIDDRAIPFDDKKVKKYERRQDLPKFFRPNGAVYVVKKKVLMEQNTLYPKNSRVVLMPKERSIDIDSAIDLELANLLIKKYK